MLLGNRRVIMVIAEGYHEHEYWFPYYRFREEGAHVVTAGQQVGIVNGEGKHGKDGLPAEISHQVEQLADMAFDVLYLPGGIFSPLALRVHEPTLALVRRAMDGGAIVGAICHAQWILVSAGVVEGRRLTCPPDMSDDVRNAGGVYVTERCVRDRNLITAVYYAYLPEHFQMLIPALLELPAGRRD
jgi:protease I